MFADSDAGSRSGSLTLAATGSGTGSLTLAATGGGPGSLTLAATGSGFGSLMPAATGLGAEEFPRGGGGPEADGGLRETVGEGALLEQRGEGTRRDEHGPRLLRAPRRARGPREPGSRDVLPRRFERAAEVKFNRHASHASGGFQ